MSTAESRTLDVAARLRTRRKLTVSGWLVSVRTIRWNARYHFWIIALLMAFGALTYYVQHTPLGRTSSFARIAADPHDLLRTLFLIPVLYSAIVFRVKGSLVGSLAFLAIVLPRPFICDPYPDSMFRTLMFVAVGMFVTYLVAITLNRADKEHLKLQQFLSDTMNTQEREKQYLARELHDESLQRLVDVSHGIDDLMEPKDLAEIRKLKQLREEVNTVLTGIRGFIMGLRPPLLDEMGLQTSLRWLVHAASEEQGTRVELEMPDPQRRLSSAVELNLYRIAQEALQNVKKHARATRTTVNLTFASDRVRLEIKDNGVGFAVPVVNRLTGQMQFGLIGMAERARLIGGSLRIESVPGNGTLIFVEAPARHAEI